MEPIWVAKFETNFTSSGTTLNKFYSSGTNLYKKFSNGAPFDFGKVSLGQKKGMEILLNFVALFASVLKNQWENERNASVIDPFHSKKCKNLTNAVLRNY